MPHATHPTLLATRHLTPTTRGRGPGVCTSTCLLIEHVGAYSGGVDISTGRFWLMENSEFVEALANRRLLVCGSFG
jgi:hypothetical protein